MGTGGFSRKQKPDEPYEAPFLYLNCDKAKTLLKWRPLLTIKQAIRLTIEWYKKYKTQAVFEIAKKQIQAYAKIFKNSISIQKG